MRVIKSLKIFLSVLEMDWQTVSSLGDIQIIKRLLQFLLKVKLKGRLSLGNDGNRKFVLSFINERWRPKERFK